MAEDLQTGEVSDEDEVAEIDEDILHCESIRRRVKVGQVAGRSWFTCLVLEPVSLIIRIIFFKLMMCVGNQEVDFNK